MPRLPRHATLSLKIAELSLAAPQVIAMRVAQAMFAGATPSMGDWREFSRMWTEKVEAMNESALASTLALFEANRQWTVAMMQSWWSMWSDPAALARPGALALAAFDSPATRKRIERSMTRLALAGVTPFHRRATRNQQRLSRVAARRRRSR